MNAKRIHADQRQVFQVFWRVTEPARRDPSRGIMHVLARDAAEAANALKDTFPGGWWSDRKDCKDTLAIEEVRPHSSPIDMEIDRHADDTRGVRLIAEERRRQIEVEQWTPEHDDRHSRPVALSLAAACYAIPDPYRTAEHLAILWPWTREWWKPTPDDRARELAKAGALIAAELDRLDRANREV